MLNKPSEQMREEFLTNIHGIVEATNFERNSLWFQNEYRNLSLENGKRDWRGRASGFLTNIGNFADNNVWLSIMVDEVDGKRILFYEPTSPVVNWNMVEKWLEENLSPETYANRTDASNFHTIF